MCRFDVLVALTVSCALAACGEGSDAEADEESGALRIFPQQIYSGFDPAHTYQTPVAALGGKNVTWSVDDPSLVMLEPGSEGVMLTSRKAGSTTLRAKSGEQSVSATLTITAYTAEQYAAGEQRYKNALDDANPPCVNCHGPGKGPDHTPTEIAEFSDEAVQHTYTTGIDLEGKAIKDTTEYTMLLKGYDHMWEVSEDAKVGVVAYLRGLTPKGFPDDDE